MVEAHVPFREWLRAATGRQNEIVWLIERFESLDIPDKQKAELYDSLKLHITWQIPLRASRTFNATAYAKDLFPSRTADSTSRRFASR